jgi:hypothetical protein
LRCFSSGFSVFFGEVLSNTFLKNSFTREVPDGRICFLYYRGEAKKSSSSDSLGESVYKEAILNRSPISLPSLPSDSPVPCARSSIGKESILGRETIYLPHVGAR